MDRPYIIWTLRRTGGTSLATMLADVSSLPSLQHEPFNPDRIHGGIIKEWEGSIDFDRMRDNLRRALHARPVIKHCYELSPLPFNSMLLQETCRLKYHHIVLKRKSEIDRIFSLEAAKITGAWGPKQAKEIYPRLGEDVGSLPTLDVRKSISHMADCLLRTRWLLGEFRRLGIDRTVVNFEDLYSDPHVGLKHVKNLLLELGHPEAKVDALAERTRHLLACGEQGSSRIKGMFSNSDEWRRAMTASWRILNPSQLSLQKTDELGAD